MSDKNHFALVRNPSSPIEKTAPGAKCILSRMVSDVLAELENWDEKGENYIELEYLEAVESRRQMAAQGYAPAQYNLGICYQFGDGVEKDYVEAAKWYRKAADQNHTEAQYKLGICYENGWGVKKNYVEVVKWHRKAAGQGFALSQDDLGWCYENGRGGLQDLPEAYKFYKLAAEQNFERAVEDFKRIVTRMTAVEIAEGERRYREFRLPKK